MQLGASRSDELVVVQCFTVSQKSIQHETFPLTLLQYDHRTDLIFFYEYTNIRLCMCVESKLY